MASAAQTLPLFYKEIEPLSSEKHAKFRTRSMDRAPFLVGQHAIPLTVDEFVAAQRFLPIVFSVGPDPIPLALMGLNEGTNVFIEADGAIGDKAVYVPAYVRRYPYMLARLRADADELSLCFDPTFEGVGEFDEGEPLFDDGAPSQVTKAVLEFNQMFEEAGVRTTNFMREIAELGLLMDGEVSIQAVGNDKPYVYRGFQMVDQEKLNKLRGDQLRKIAQSGLLPLIYAHLFSLSLMRELFDRQSRLGLVPEPQPAN